MTISNKAAIITQLPNGNYALHIREYDGYPQEGIGEMLLREYNTQELAIDIAINGPKFDLTKAPVFLSHKEHSAIFNIAIQNDVSYIYTFKNGEWIVADINTHSENLLSKILDLDETLEKPLID